MGASAASGATGATRGFKLDFEKMHGLGNDFVLVAESAYERLRAQGSGFPDYPRLARLVCDRRFGVGGDGLLVVGTEGLHAAVTMRFYNPDGSESGMCGNGVRCVAWYAMQERLAAPAGDGRVAVRTGSGVVTTWVRQVLSSSSAVVEVDMGVPRLAPHEVPTLLEPTRVVQAPGLGAVRAVLDRELPLPATGLHASCVSMGNPHAVIVVPDEQALPHGDALVSLGTAVQTCGAFPEGVNVEFCHVAGPNEARVTVLERGAGITLACGSGACASAVALNLLGLLGPDARVHLPGGSLRISWDQDSGHVHMTGPVTRVFNATIHTIGALEAPEA